MYLPWFEKSGSRDKWMLSQRSEQLLFTLETEKHPLNRKHVFLPRFMNYRAHTHTGSLTPHDNQVSHPHLGHEEAGRAPNPGTGGRRQSPWPAPHRASRVPGTGTPSNRDSRHLTRALSCAPEDGERPLDGGVLESCSECSLLT